MPAVRIRPGNRASIRLRAVPPLDPPFDDESAITTWPPESVDQLALDLWAQRRDPARPGADRADGDSDSKSNSDSDGDGKPATGTGSVGARSVGRGSAGALQPGGRGAIRPLPTVTGLPATALATATPEAQQATRRLLGRCLEILNGYRPVGHIRPLATPVDAAAIMERLGAAGRRLSAPPAHPRRQTSPIRLRAVRVCEPRPGVAEIAAVLDRSERAWAMTLRLERRRGNWLATTAELL